MSETARAGAGQVLGEFVATFGLIGTILCTAGAFAASLFFGRLLSDSDARAVGGN